MKKVIIITLIIIILITGFVFLNMKKSPVPIIERQNVNSSENTIVDDVTETLNPVASSEAKTGETIILTEEIRNKIRTEFILNCKKQYGEDAGSACNCGADFLEKNYSTEVLKKVYNEYHSNGKITIELSQAYQACKDK